MPIETNKQDYVVCTCMGVMYSEIYNTLCTSDARDIAALSDMLMVGMGCNSCIPELEHIIQAFKTNNDR